MTNALPASPVSFDNAMFIAKQNQNVISDRVLKTKEAAKDFEAVFISEMMSHMFNGIDVDPMFGGGPGEEMFRSMMVNEYGKKMANSGNGIGIATQLERAMLEMQQLEGVE